MHAALLQELVPGQCFANSAFRGVNDRGDYRTTTDVPLESAAGSPSDYVEKDETYAHEYGLPELGSDQAIAT